jgi:phage gp29-like protein
MSFDNNGGLVGSESPMKDCKPDYEKQAAGLKKKLDATTRLEESIFAFSDINGGHRFSKISSLAEFIGGLAIVKREQSRGYDELLSRIEKE